MMHTNLQRHNHPLEFSVEFAPISVSPHGANTFTSTPGRYCVGYHRSMNIYLSIDRWYKLVATATRGAKGQEEECEGRNDNLGWLPNELFDIFPKKLWV